MAKKVNDNKKKPGKKSPKKSGQKAKQEKKKVTVYLPMVIQKPDEEIPLCEEEISYKDRLLALDVERLAAKGLTNDEIIANLPISRDTFYKKLKNQPYFAYALYKHRGIAVQDVENAMHKRAIGYTYLEKTIEAKPVVKMDLAGNIEKTFELMESKIIEKEVPGDVKAQEIFLTNRDSMNWKKKVEPNQVHGGQMKNIVFSIKRRSE